MKKSIFTLAFLLFVAVQIFAQAPQTINFQAVARKPNGDPNANVTVQVQFIIRNNDPQNGLIVYNSGSQNLQTDACGMFTAKIGEMNQSQFSQIDWANSTKYLEVKADGLPIGNQQMVSVPYALYAEKTKLQAGNGISVSGNTITNSGDTDPNNDVEQGDAAGGDLKDTYPNPKVDGIQGIPVSPNTPTQGQVLIYENGQWKPAKLPSPEIAIFTESYGTASGGNAVTGTNKRKLNSFSTNNTANITLNDAINNNTVTLQPGRYYIQASAPAYKVNRHFLFITNQSTNEIMMLGTNEFAWESSEVSTTSFISGVTPDLTSPTIIRLDHWVQAGGGPNSLGLSHSDYNSGITNTYATITIQKIN